MRLRYLPRLPAGNPAFSLVEVLFVISIITLLLFLTLPAFEQMLKGSRVTIAGNAVVDQLNLAQQTAISRNEPVEVRVYRLPDESLAPATRPPPKDYRALQLFKTRPDGNVEPLQAPLILPAGVIFVSNPSSSSILDQSNSGPLTDKVVHPASDSQPLIQLPGYGNNYEFRRFRFRSNGETDMKQVAAFVTLVSRADKVQDFRTNLPGNFYTVQVDPVNGRTRSYRP